MSGSQTVTWNWTAGKSPTACYIDPTGIHAPPFQDILTYLQSQMQGIFGQDIFLGNDSQDGQMLGIFATAIYDTNSLAIATYNSYSPITAQGIGLSSVVKINGISRTLPTNSTVDVTLAGVVGTTIVNGQIADTNFNKWTLPPSVTIPVSGAITVTALAVTSGAVTAAPNTVTTIATPTFGWQTVTNPASANPGIPLESDSILRIRQTQSTMLPSVTALDGMVGAVASIPNVSRLAVYENDTDIPDSNGIPGHSISFVIEGGDASLIAQAIAQHKTPGAGTYGNIVVTVTDIYGIPHNIRFFIPTLIQITVTIHVTPLLGYTTSVGAEIVSAVVDYINSVPIGQNVYQNKVVSVANLPGSKDSLTFNVSSVLLARGGGNPAAQDITIAFNETSITDTSVSGVTLAIP